MAVFNGKIFNDKVFEKYLRTLPSTKENAMLQSSIFENVSKYEAKLSEQAGGNYIVEPIKGRIGGDAQNYDGDTDIDAGTGRVTYKQGKVVIGRDKAWGEDDFTREITGTNFMAEASEVKEYWDDRKQELVLSILKGIFNMTGNNDFATKHTYEVNSNLAANTCNVAAQKAIGDKKKNLKVMFMHSAVSTNLEGLQLLEYLKYTDANGIQRDLTIGQYNGKIVFIDDDMPVLEGYDTATSTDTDALLVVASGATTGQINLADVKKAAFYPANVAADDYVKAGTKYVTYMLGSKYFEFEEVGVLVPTEVARNAYSNGGHSDLISRKRAVIVPKYVGFTKASMAKLSPTNAELENGANWELVHTEGDNPEYVNDKLVELVRIISRG